MEKHYIAMEWSEYHQTLCGKKQLVSDVSAVSQVTCKKCLQLLQGEDEGQDED